MLRTDNAAVTWSCGSLHCIVALACSPHDLPELLVHSGEGLGLMRQLALDVRGSEYGLQVHPLLLAGQPFIQSVAEQVQLLVYPLHLTQDSHNEPAHSQSH